MAYNYESPYFGGAQYNNDWLLKKMKENVEMVEKLNAIVEPIPGQITDLDTRVKALEDGSGVAPELYARVGVLETDMQTVQGQISTIDGQIASLDTKIGQNYTDLDGKISDNYTDLNGKIVTLQNEDATIHTLIEQNTNDINRLARSTYLRAGYYSWFQQLTLPAIPKDGIFHGVLNATGTLNASPNSVLFFPPYMLVQGNQDRYIYIPALVDTTNTYAMEVTADISAAENLRDYRLTVGIRASSLDIPSGTLLNLTLSIPIAFYEQIATPSTYRAQKQLLKLV